MASTHDGILPFHHNSASLAVTHCKGRIMLRVTKKVSNFYCVKHSTFLMASLRAPDGTYRKFFIIKSENCASSNFVAFFKFTTTKMRLVTKYFHNIFPRNDEEPLSSKKNDEKKTMREQKPCQFYWFRLNF